MRSWRWPWGSWIPSSGIHCPSGTRSDGTRRRSQEVLGELFTGQLGVVFLRTLVYVAVATALSLLIGYPVAYYLARHAGRYRVLLLMLIIAPFWINYLMRMLAWVNLLTTDGYVNQILMFVGALDAPREWLVGKPETVILGLVYGYVPFLILPLFAALDRIDPARHRSGAGSRGKPGSGLLARHAAALVAGGPRRVRDHHAPDVRRLLHGDVAVRVPEDEHDRQADRAEHQRQRGWQHRRRPDHRADGVRRPPDDLLPLSAWQGRRERPGRERTGRHRPAARRS